MRIAYMFSIILIYAFFMHTFMGYFYNYFLVIMMSKGEKKCLLLNQMKRLVHILNH